MQWGVASGEWKSTANRDTRIEEQFIAEGALETVPRSADSAGMPQAGSQQWIMQSEEAHTQRPRVGHPKGVAGAGLGQVRLRTKSQLTSATAQVVPTT